MNLTAVKKWRERPLSSGSDGGMARATARAADRMRLRLQSYDTLLLSVLPHCVCGHTEYVVTAVKLKGRSCNVLPQSGDVMTLHQIFRTQVSGQMAVKR